MKNSSDLTTLADRILQVIRTTPGQKAKDIAKCVAVDSTKINSLLHGTLRLSVIQDLSYQWWPIETPGVNNRERKFHQGIDSKQSIPLQTPTVTKDVGNLERFEVVLALLGPEQHDWLARLWKSYPIQKGPITADDGEILAEPLFWLQINDRLIACLGNEEPAQYTLHKLEDKGIEVIRPGQKFVT